MNRELSSLDVYVIVYELQELIGTYIEKIHQPEKNELVLKLKKRETKQKETLFIRNEELICLTTKKIDALKTPTTFAMTLRKYILNGMITEVKQHQFDRIIQIEIQKKEGAYTLVFEFFKKGNIILLNSKKEIILPLKIQRWAHRTIKPHTKYIPPPPQLNPLEISLEEFKKIIKESTSDLVRTLAVNLNLGGEYAEEICTRANIEKNLKTSEIDENTIQKIHTVTTDFLNLFKKHEIQPKYLISDKEKIGIYPLTFQKYKKDELIETTSFTRGLEEFIKTPKIIPIDTKKYQEQHEKLKRQLKQQEKLIEEFKQKIQNKKQEGEILYLNFQECEKILNEIKNALSQKEKEQKIEQINKEPSVKIFDPISNKLILILPDNTGKQHEIKIDFRKTIAKNAEGKYKESKKFNEKQKGAEKAIEITNQKIKKLEKDKKTIEEIKEKETAKKTFWFERYHWFISSNENLVIGGKDAKTNELVVKKHLKEGDRYVHADVHGAASCIVKASDINNKPVEILDKTLNEACIFAGCNSKAWKQFAETQAYWVSPEQVSKTPQSGEFVPKGAFIIRGKRNYQKVKLEMGIAEIKIEDIKKIMCGPIDSIQSKTDKYVIITPGVIKKNTAAKQLSKILNVTMDEIIRVLPPGDIQIVKTEGYNL